MSKVIPWLLFASVLVNGFLAGLLFNQHPGPSGPPRRPGEMIEKMASVLSPADAEILRAAAATELLSHEPPPHWEMEEFRRKTAELMMAEPFDEAAFKTHMEEFRQRRERMNDGLGNILTQALPKISAEGRRRLAQLHPPEPMPPPPRERK